jgi:hypothetical protein
MLCVGADVARHGRSRRLFSSTRVTGRLSRRHIGVGYYASGVSDICRCPAAWPPTFCRSGVHHGSPFEIFDFALDLVSLAALVVVILGDEPPRECVDGAVNSERQLTAQLAS